MVFVRTQPRSDHAFHHESLEPSTVLDVGGRVPEVFLVHEFGLRQQVGGDEPAGTKLPAIGTDITGDARKLTVCLVVACADEQLLVRQKAVDRVDGVLIPGPFRSLGQSLALRTLDDPKELKASEFHEWIHLERRNRILEAGVDQTGVLLCGLGRGRVFSCVVVATSPRGPRIQGVAHRHCRTYTGPRQPDPRSF